FAFYAPRFHEFMVSILSNMLNSFYQIHKIDFIKFTKIILSDFKIAINLNHRMINYNAFVPVLPKALASRRTRREICSPPVIWPSPHLQKWGTSFAELYDERKKT
ncbi:MAG: hypothetical protein IIZ29_02970, partial [Schwartzia sp.]|nr:hypothetical protein [Schwartzia sp. (in: firmicutes)]